MIFIRSVEEDLRALSTEARRSRHLSGVKEAAERGIVRLRSLQEEYSAALRRARQSAEAAGGDGAAAAGPGAELLRCQEVLHPFLLACNHADAGAKLTLTALSGLQHLLDRDAIEPSDGPNVMRVVVIQARP